MFFLKRTKVLLNLSNLPLREINNISFSSLNWEVSTNYNLKTGFSIAYAFKTADSTVSVHISLELEV